VGISSEEPKVASYRHFADHVLPHIARQGYNAVQLMAVMEHAYYASFGYQVRAPGYGRRTVGDVVLRRLVALRPARGPAVLGGHGARTRPVHAARHSAQVGERLLTIGRSRSHASPNTDDGLNRFDGTDGCFFHDSGRGNHEQWGSRLFNYTE